MNFAAYYNISAERVRQLEKSALQQLKKHMPVDTYVATES